MNTESMTEIVVHRSVTVPLKPDRAFELFTAKMTAYWPPDHSIGKAAMADIIVEPHVGGRWYERGVDGTECDWGRVAAWDPPYRLVLLWQISADWRFDPDLVTEVEVTFAEEPGGHSRVDLRHRHLERYGDSAKAMRGIVDSPNGWTVILSGYLTAASNPGEDMRLSLYARSLDQFARVLTQVPNAMWDTWSPCTGWTARDIVGHTIWGQQLIYAWATGTEPPSYRYAPGGDRPGPLTGADPVAAWNAARAACAGVLDGHLLARMVETPAGAPTIGGVVDNLIVDNTVHAWDLGTTAGVDVRLDADLVDNAHRWAAQNEVLVRDSGLFAEPLTPPTSADEQTTLLARLGRRAW